MSDVSRYEAHLALENHIVNRNAGALADDLDTVDGHGRSRTVLVSAHKDDIECRELIRVPRVCVDLSRPWVDVVIAEPLDGEVRILKARSIKEFKGALKRPMQRAVSLEEMEAAIAAGASDAEGNLR